MLKGEYDGISVLKVSHGHDATRASVVDHAICRRSVGAWDSEMTAAIDRADFMQSDKSVICQLKFCSECCIGVNGWQRHYVEFWIQRHIRKN